MASSRPAEAPVALSAATVVAIAKSALEANGIEATMDRQARSALQRAANVYCLYLAAVADEHWRAQPVPKRGAPRGPLKASHIEAAELDAGIITGRAFPARREPTTVDDDVVVVA
jgi:hypothetical protein